MGVEIAQGKGVIIRRPDAQELLKIRRGEINLEDLWNQSEKDLKIMDEAFEVSTLPETVDKTLLDRFLQTIRYKQLSEFKKSLEKI